MEVELPSASEPTSDIIDDVATKDSCSTPRLMITKMVLENFKSYAGTKTIGPFHKCFSSVVGPNGSGKSNVIDAMLFVFGKRAKKLRLNKVSELIHCSDKYKDKPLQYARVSVHFHEIIDTGGGDEDYNVVPDSEVIVTRIAKRDNSSNYKLGNKNCAFKEVAKYLDSKGIDLDNNRFLILQGEVEMISMMPPKGKTENDEGLLEYLEDIIGSNKFVEETNEAEAKVETLTEQRQEKLNRVKAVEKEKNSLEGAKLEAEALLTKEREIRRKKNILYQINIMHVATEVKETEVKKIAVATNLEEERVKLKVADERVAEIDNGLSSQNNEYDKAHAELVRTKEEFAVYERRDIKLREDIKHEKANKKKLALKVTTETKKESEGEAKSRAAEESVPILEQELKDLTGKKSEEDAKLEQIFEETKGETENLRRELEIKTQELAPVTQERAVFQAALDTATTEVKLLEDSTTRAKEQLASAEKELASLDTTQQEKRATLASCEDELIASKHRIVEANKEEAELAEQEKTLAKRNTELMTQVEESKASLQAGVTRSQAVAGILKAARGGGELANVGVLGRLGDLASISEQYDVAVSTACGMLDHIVVQTTAGAQRCLSFLRKHGLGRANFIPLDKMKKGAHDRTVETPEGAPRLFDVITPSNFAITPALYLGVGNTLVAPDLETATKWAYDFGKRWRVVTIDGNLIELSGTMQGGGKTVRRGGMRLLNSRAGSTSNFNSLNEMSKEECLKLETLATQTMEQLKNCKAKRRLLLDEIRKLNNAVKRLSTKMPKLSLEIASCDTSREELTKRIPELQGQCTLNNNDAAKLVDLSTKVQKCKSDMASCAMLASKLESNVARLQKSILDAGGSRLKKQQQSCDSALSELNIMSKQLNSTKVKIRSSKKAATKAMAAKKTAEEDLEKSRASLEQKKCEFKVLEDEAMKVMEEFETVKKIEQEKKEMLQAVSAECDDLKKAQSKIKCIEIELIAKVENYDKTIDDFEKRGKHWRNELIKLLSVEDQETEDEFTDIEIQEGDKNNNESDMDEVIENGESANLSSTLNAREEKRNESSLPTYPIHALEQYNDEEVKNDINILEKEQKVMAKNANMTAIEEYRRKERDYLARVTDLDEISDERNEAIKSYEDLRRLRLEKFMEGFGHITLKLKEMYQMITLGGDAELELVDSLDPFSEGIVFSVRPPKKSWKNISNLSGGEKTLSSLALVFALHHYKPTPLYVMDEIDAALDFKNVSIVANYIKERTKNAQFIIISLRNNMFELADRLVGIYKTFNSTKSITIDPKAFSNKALNGTHISPFRDSTNLMITDEKDSLQDPDGDTSQMLQ